MTMTADWNWADRISLSYGTRSMLECLKADYALKQAMALAPTYPFCARAPRGEVNDERRGVLSPNYCCIEILAHDFWAFRTAEARQAFIESYPEAEIFP
jgi:hypothetical protein